MKINSEKIKKILIVSLSNVGDCILTMPVLASLKKAFPLAGISVVVGPSAKGVFENDKRIDEVIVYNKRTRFKDKLRFIGELKKKNYELVVDLRGSLIPLLLGSRYSTGIFRNGRKGVHKMDEHLSRVKQLGIEPASAKESLHIDETSEEYAYDFLRNEGLAPNETLIGMAAGAKSLIKRWPKENYARLADMLAQSYKAKVVLFGSADETALNHEIKGLMKSNAVLASGKTTISQLISLIRRLDLLVTNDSAALHIASLLGVPQVAIFGPTDHKKYGPLGKRDIVIRKALKCSPCEVAQCNKRLECMTEVSPEEVFAAAASVLKKR